jgi:hypothetical protein
VPFAGGEALPESFVVETQIFSAAVDLAETSADMAGRWSADYDQALLGGVGGARTRDQRITGRADASRCFFGVCLARRAWESAPRCRSTAMAP